MDVNPLAISKGHAFALAARIIIDKDSLDYKSSYPHLVIAPYPTRYVMPWRDSTGTEVLLRPIKPEDEPLVRDMLSFPLEKYSQGTIFSGHPDHHPRDAHQTM